MAGMQDKDIYKRPYVRPNENWVCGLSAEGRPCPHGPSTRGKCTAKYECKPAQVGERWVCTRPEQYGGPCDDPALPEPSFGPHAVNGVGVCCRKVHCTPQRSLRAKRGRLSVILCSLIAGIVLLSVGGPWRDRFFSPGPLTAAHQGASLASQEGMSHGKAGLTTQAGGDSAGCHTCHTVAKGGLAGMLQAAVSQEEKTPQSKQCLVCHIQDIGDNALFTHALEPDVLAKHTAEAEAEPFRASKPLSLALAAFSPGVKTGAGGQLACAGCHHEHNGAFFDLKRLDNQQCQSCHVKEFKSIASGHPEFSTLASSAGYDYPYRRRTRIVFDHASHETDYFQREENLAHAPADCMACHAVGDGARATALKPFEEMCAACHTNNIVASTSPPIFVFGYPSLEDEEPYGLVEEVAGANSLPRRVGQELSPIMLLLQSGIYGDDDAGRATFLADIETLLDGYLTGVVLDVDNGPEIGARLFQGAQAVYDRAMVPDEGIRKTLADLLSRVRGSEVDSAQFDAMFGFPEPGDTIEDLVKDLTLQTNTDIVQASGWYAEGSGYRVNNTAWKAALFAVEPYAAFQSALDGVDSAPYAKLLDFFSSYSEFRKWFDANFRIAGDRGDWMFLAPEEEAEKKTGYEIERKVQQADWKALVAKIADLPGADAEEEKAEGGDKAPAKEGDDAGKEEAGDSSAETGGAAELSEAGDAFVEWLTDLTKVKRWVEDNFNTSESSWTLRTPQSIYYRPVQHADPFLTAWIDFTAELYMKNRAAAMVFDELTGRTSGLATGACVKCHSVDVEEKLSGEKTVHMNWKSKQPRRAFTTFNHSPHLKLMDCAQCHRAPWIPELSERVQVAKAASAEEETAAEPAPAEEEQPAETVAESAADTAAPVEETSASTESAPAEEAAAPAESAPEQSTAPEPAPEEAAPADDSTEVASAAPAPAARPDLSYLDSFKVEKGGQEVSVNFSNRNHAPGQYAFVSNFEPVTKADCARCHVPGKAGDSCLICHNYHIGNEHWSAGVRSLSDLLTAAPAAESTPEEGGVAPASN